MYQFRASAIRLLLLVFSILHQKTGENKGKMAQTPGVKSGVWEKINVFLTGVRKIEPAEKVFRQAQL
ncbi:hypothetical protein BACCAP_00693 [Pseudoflavonifractor capillosus ATCC 29799]|uniref:Uncharacterized protein n=1 Tax=Pseudoflavonifractor capillosus ATCC 29799 TaxID=411467 RepID=A6NR68_9FIRM|nr:hypothetical protein BACCAP_00693 [Pseudoflavonifractor capillosus ATCC 29799]